MSQRTVIAINNTVSNVIVNDFGSLIIPVGGQVTISEVLTLNEIQKSSEFDNYVQSGQVVVNTGSETLTANVAANYLTPLAVVAEEDPNLDIELNTEKRHNQAHLLGSSADHTTDSKANLDGRISDASLISTLSGEINAITAKTAGAQTDIVLIEDSEATYAKKKMTIENVVLSALGYTGAVYVYSSATDSTTSTTYQNKVTLTTNVVAGASYRLSFSMGFNSNANNKAVEVRMYDSTEAVELGANYQETNNSTNWFTFAGTRIITPVATGSHSFALQYRQAPSGGAQCSVRNAFIDLARVGT